MHHGDLRNAGCRHARLVGEAAPAFHEHLRLVEQIGTAGFDEAHERQLVFECDLLNAQVLLHAHRRRGAALDGAVIRGNDAADARHVTDAGDAAAALDALGAVIVVHAQAGERRQFEPRRTRIDQQRDTLARQKLAAGAKPIASGVGEIPHLLLERAEAADKRQHLLAIGAKRFGVGIDAALYDRHERFSCALGRRGSCKPRSPSRRRRHTAVSAMPSARSFDFAETSLHFADPQMPFVPRKNIGYDDPGKRANEAANALTRANEEPSAARGNYGSGAWE